MEKMPANFSYVVLVHGGAFKTFTETLPKHFPELHIKFVKKIAIHYYVVQLECASQKPINIKFLQELPVMAFRDEFSSYIFFKNAKAFGTTLKRMCSSKDDDGAAIELVEYMLTPWEKIKLLNIREQDDIEIKTVEDKITRYSMFSGSELFKNDSLQKVFEHSSIIVNNREKDIIKEIEGSPDVWTIGIC